MDDVFPGFELGDFVVLQGHAVLPMVFVLAIRSQLPRECGGLNSSIVFVDGGNSFNPYLLAEIARDQGVDYHAVLEKIYVSRAFTAYQLCSLILEKLDSFLKEKKAKLLIISDITSLLYREISKDEAEDLFTKICGKLSEIVARKQAVVIVSYSPKSESGRRLLFESILFRRANALVKLKKNGKALSFVLEKHARIKPFSINFPTDHIPLTNFMEVRKAGKDCPIL